MKCTSLPLQRREFITLLGGAAAAWPLAARAQQPSDAGDRVLMRHRRDDPECSSCRGVSRRACRNWAMSRARTSRSNTAGRRANTIALPALGGRSGPPSSRRCHRRAAAPSAALAAKAATATIPIVFAHGDDPVELGLVASLSAAGRQRHRRHHVRVDDWRRNGWSCCTRWCLQPTRIGSARQSDRQSGASDACARHRGGGAHARTASSRPSTPAREREIERAFASIRASANGAL